MISKTHEKGSPMDTITTCQFCKFGLYFTVTKVCAEGVVRRAQSRSQEIMPDEQILDKHCPSCGLVYTLADEEQDTKEKMGALVTLTVGKDEHVRKAREDKIKCLEIKIKDLVEKGELADLNKKRAQHELRRQKKDMEQVMQALDEKSQRILGLRDKLDNQATSIGVYQDELNDSKNSNIMLRDKTNHLLNQEAQFEEEIEELRAELSNRDAWANVIKGLLNQAKELLEDD